MSAVVAAWLMATTAFAARAKTEWRTYVQPDGSMLTLTIYGDEHFSCYRDSEGRMYARDSIGTFHLLDAELVRHQVALTRSEMPDMSYEPIQWDPNRTYRQLVVLVSFTDCDFSFDNPQETYHAIFNQSGYNQMDGPGCVADYFRDQSKGLFNLQFDVYGPYKVNAKVKSNSSGNYGTQLFREAVGMLIEEHPDIDYSVYDWDNDGTVNQTVFVYAGYSGNQVGLSGYIWPNTYSFSTVKTPDGYAISRYTASGELWTNNTSCGFGLICHELSHCLGLPDIYPTNTNDSSLPISIVDEWDVMDGGTFTNRGWCPPNYSPMEKICMGWLTPTELKTDTVISHLKPVANGGNAFLIRHTNKEFYLLENRQWEGWDYGLPGKGLLIYHVLYDNDHWLGNNVNNISNQPHYHIVTADNMTYTDWYNYWLDNYSGKSPYTDRRRLNSQLMSTASYPCLLDSAGNMNRELSATTTPATVMYTANDKGDKMMAQSITDITQHEDGTVSFTFHTSGAGIISTKAPSPVSGVYTITGRKLANHTDFDQLPKGIYIVNGKKIIR